MVMSWRQGHAKWFFSPEIWKIGEDINLTLIQEMVKFIAHLICGSSGHRAKVALEYLPTALLYLLAAVTIWSVKRAFNGGWCFNYLKFTIVSREWPEWGNKFLSLFASHLLDNLYFYLQMLFHHLVRLIHPTVLVVTQPLRRCCCILVNLHFPLSDHRLPLLFLFYAIYYDVLLSCSHNSPRGSYPVDMSLALPIHNIHTQPTS